MPDAESGARVRSHPDDAENATVPLVKAISSKGNWLPWTEGGWVDSLPRTPSGGKQASWYRYWLAAPGDGAGEAPPLLWVQAPP